MARINIEGFLVKVECLLQRNEKLFVSGSCVELGDWYPLDSIPMKRFEMSKANNYEVWGVDVPMKLKDFHYRYFIATTDDNHESRDERNIIITSWESNVFPRSRKISELMNRNNSYDEPCSDVYGYIDDHYRTLRGWLIDHTAVQLRLYRDPVRLYKTKHKFKRVNVRLKHFQICRELWGSDDEDDQIFELQDCSKKKSCMESANSRPLIYNMAKVSRLVEGETEPRTCPEMGVPLLSGANDMLTFHFITTDLEDTSIELEFIQPISDLSCSVTPSPSVTKINELNESHSLPNSPSRSPNSENGLASEPLQPTTDGFVVVGIARLALMPNDRSIKVVPIYNIANRPIGEVKIDFLAVRPLLGYSFNLERTYQKHWKHRKTLKVGHKGSGTSYGECNETKISAIRENTLYSLKNAHDYGADYVEFDVQLSKDKVPVVYHDFKVATVLRKKKRNELQYMEIPVKDIDLKDLQALKVDHTSVLHTDSQDLNEMEDVDTTDLQPFPTLESCLKTIHMDVGFNIELKFPQQMQNGTFEQSNYFGRNEFADAVLSVVVKHARNRRIIFSSFDPDLCITLLHVRFCVLNCISTECR